MIGAARTWITGVVMVTMLLSVVQTLVPEGTMRRITSFCGGLLLLASLLQPVAQIEELEINWGLDDYEQAIHERQTELEKSKEEELSTLIARQTEAYISDKAVQLGLSCHVEVATALRQGIPCPDTVTLDIAKNETLAKIIAQDVGVAKEKQRWLGE